MYSEMCTPVDSESDTTLCVDKRNGAYWTVMDLRLFITTKQSIID